MITDISSNDHFGPILTAIFVYGVGILGFGMLLLDAQRRKSREAREAHLADASVHINPTLAPGPAVLFGTVEYAQAADAAVRVDIDQDGEEWENSGSWSHKWTEKNRRVHVEPFYVRVNPDKRIRVEPTRDVFLVDDMDGVIRVDLMKRTRFAQLVPGEEVYASGELVRGQDPEAIGESSGYRSARETLVLRPRAGEPMLLSSQPLGDRHQARVAFYSTAMFWIGAVMLCLHVAFGGVHLRLFFGETIAAKITKLEHYTTRDDDDNETDHYRVTAEAPGGITLSDHVDFDFFPSLREGEDVPFRFVPGIFSNRSTIGSEITVHAGAFCFLPILAVVYWIYRHQEKKSKPWYERDLVDTASGRLEETFEQEKAASAAKS